MHFKTGLFVLSFCLLSISLVAQNPYFPGTLNMRERAEVIDAWLEEPPSWW